MAEQNEQEKDIIRMWRVWRTAREMCYDRGYELTDEEVSITLDNFRNTYAPDGFLKRKDLNFSARPSEDMLAKYTDPPTAKNPHPQAQIGTIWVEFNDDASVGIKELRRFAHHIDEHNFHTGVFVSAVRITPAALKIIPTVLPRILEVFEEVDLLVNITRHELVPKHILLSKQDKLALLERYRVKESQLPRIQVNDPVSRYLGLRRGQVVKIIRKSETAGRYASYRWVI